MAVRVEAVAVGCNNKDTANLTTVVRNAIRIVTKLETVLDNRSSDSCRLLPPRTFVLAKGGCVAGSASATVSNMAGANASCF